MEFEKKHLNNHGFQVLIISKCSMVCMHAYLILHSAFMLSMVKMPLKGEVGGGALNSHGNYIIDHGKSWNCVFEICGNTAIVRFRFDFYCSPGTQGINNS